MFTENSVRAAVSPGRAPRWSAFKFCGWLLPVLLCVLAPLGRAATVTVNPGANLQSLINSYPQATTFMLTPGMYRLQSLVPKNYDAFIGTSGGAILSGAALLTSFSQSGTYWTANVQVSPKTADTNLCYAATPTCSLPEDLFFDDVPKRRVASLSQVGFGSWYLDYAGGKAYMGDNPAGHKVEISLLTHAFSGTATGVTISVLTIEKYSSPSEAGAIEARDSAENLSSGWTVKWCDVRLNHGVGIRIGNSTYVHHNKIYRNGELGVGGNGQNSTIYNNEISYNNYAGYKYSRGGGTKFANCYNLKIRYNYSHDNLGPGLWTDINGDLILYEYNHTTQNRVAGIFHEIGYRCTVRYNTIENDGYTPYGSSIWWGAGILNNSSSNMEVYGNTVKNCANGIGGIQGDRGNGPNGQPYLLQNYNVHDNTITQVTGTAAGIVRAADFDNSVYSDWGNHFQNNTFNLTYPDYKYFVWFEEYWTYAQWQQYNSLH